MTVLDQILLGVVAAVLLLTTGLITMTLWGNTVLMRWLAQMQQNPVDGGIAALLIACLAIYLIFMIIKSDSDQQAVVHTTGLGSVHISLHSVRDLVLKTTHQMQGIKGATVVFTQGEPIRIRLDLVLLPDHHIPHLTETVQTNVRDYLQATVGITVEEIDVYVKGISSSIKTRVG